MSQPKRLLVIVGEHGDSLTRWCYLSSLDDCFWSLTVTAFWA
jgi:hypothetical protein